MKNEKVSWTGYVSLVLGIIFFSGVFADFGEREDMFRYLAALDFSNLLGTFGRLGSVSSDMLTEHGLDGLVTLANDFRGTGGSGARDGFIFAFTLIPAVMLAIGVVKMIEHAGGLDAAKKLLGPLLRPLMGVPGDTAIAIIAGLQSTDAGAGLIKGLYEDKRLNEQEKLITAAFQFSAGGTVTNYLGSGIALFAALSEAGINPMMPLVLILVLKVFGGNLMRLYCNKVLKGNV